MDGRGDFVEQLGPDTSTNVMSYLDNPADVVRLSLVSRSWRQFVIANGFCRKMCTGKFPELLPFSHVIELGKLIDYTDVGSSAVVEQKSMETEHRVYACLAHELKSATTRTDCILESICASSTDNYPDESIENTLTSSEVVGRRPSYWSSEGESDPEVPEKLKYRLCAKLCIVEEINIQPFRAFFQNGNPIYSAKAVKFKMGYLKMPLDVTSNLMCEIEANKRSDDENYHWTYVSPVFPMAQENRLQTFKLPRPVLCLGGILQIELLGRVQKQNIDGLYYICVCHVQVVGRPISSSFDLEIQTFPGRCILKYSPQTRENFCQSTPGSDDEKPRSRSGWSAFSERIMQRTSQSVWNQLNILLHDGHESSDDDDVASDVI